MKKVALISAGNSKFGVRMDAEMRELAFEASKEAIDHSGIGLDDIELITVGCVGSRMYELLPAVPITEYTGLSGKGLVRVEAACATGSAAIYTAYSAIASGQADIVMALGLEKAQEVDTPTFIAVGGRGGNYLWEFHFFGTTFAAYYALYATAYMNKYGATEEDLCRVAVKNHYYGAKNPKAHFQKEITVEKCMSSRYIAWPLKLYDCCPISDGSAAAILASEEKVKELGIDTPIWIEAIGVSSDTSNISRRNSYTGLDAGVLAGKRAYNRAGIDPENPLKYIDLAEVHDCFTIAELMAYEDLNFCKRGEAYKLIREKQTYIGGKIPVNLSGGLKAKGHPLGATGVGMAYEVMKQLRGEAENGRQAPIKNGRALTHNIGGTGHYGYVIIYRRD